MKDKELRNKEETKHKRTRNTIALLLHGLHLLQGLLDSSIPLLFRLNHLGIESLFLPLVRLTLGLHLGSTEVQLRLQNTNFGGQLFLGFRREKEVNMVLEKD
jgi:hypothetical protein